MKKHTLIIFVLACIIIILASVMLKLSIDSKSHIDTIKKSDITVRINEFEIPSYIFNDEVYITAQNLPLLGIDCDFDKANNSLNIKLKKGYFVTQNNIISSLIYIDEGTKITKSSHKTYIEGNEIIAYSANNYTIIPLSALEVYCKINFDGQSTYYATLGDFSEKGSIEKKSDYKKRIIVLDPGHGKSSVKMSDKEKEKYGWVKNSSGNWGEWRHFKSGENHIDCEGTDCIKKAPQNGSCWYPIENSNRDIEPQINLNNCLAAKEYLEKMGYEVRLTRTSNEENPSISKRLSFCYPNNDISSSPDALLFVSIHSNAGGASGSSYVSLGGNYDQPHIKDDYVKASNTLGDYINKKIEKNTLLKTNPPISGLESLIAFCKSPVICGYMEIGFYDNSNDLAILNESSDAIGKSIAEGIDEFINEY